MPFPPEKLDTSSKTDSTQGEHTEGQSITVNPEVSSAITPSNTKFLSKGIVQMISVRYIR